MIQFFDLFLLFSLWAFRRPLIQKQFHPASEAFHRPAPAVPTHLDYSPPRIGPISVFLCVRDVASVRPFQRNTKSANCVSLSFPPRRAFHRLSCVFPPSFPPRHSRGNCCLHAPRLFRTPNRLVSRQFSRHPARPPPAVPLRHSRTRRRDRRSHHHHARSGRQPHRRLWAPIARLPATHASRG